MSLKVWLPLINDTNNQGLSNTIVVNNGAVSNTNGKLGKCYSFGTNTSYLELSNTTMTQFTTECSLSFWLNIISWNTNYATFFQAGLGSYSWKDYIFGVLRNSNTSRLCFSISNGSNSSAASYTTPDLELNTWYHLTFVYKTGHCLIYINGELHNDYSTTYVPAFSSISKTTIGISNTKTNYQSNCKMNDIRIYDHALSKKEIKELSKGLVCHYPLNGINNSILPLGYQQLEYIESSGKSYFNTEYYFNPEIDSYKIEFKGNDITNNGMILANVNNNTGYMWVYYYGNGNRISMWLHDGTSGAGGGAFTQDLNKHIMEYDNKRNYIDGNLINNFSAKTYVQCGEPLYMFSYNNSYSYPFKGRIYYVNIKREGKPQRIYIPAKRLSDNTIGMYELVNNKFCVSMTNTPFDAGPVVDTPTTIYDCSGYKNNGIISGDLTINSDSPRYDVSTYIPSNGYISHLNILNNTSQEWTCCAWIKLVSAVYSKLNNFNLGNFIIFSSGKPLLYLNSGNNDYYVYGSQTISAGVWTHIAFVFNNAAGIKNVYTNGVLTNGSGVNKSSTPSGLPDIIKICEGNFDVYISDYREYATALSDNDILELYNTSVSIDNKNKLYAYEFSESLSDLGFNISKQGVINTSGKEMEVEEEDMINGFVETDSTLPTKIYENYVGANEFVEI